MRHSLPGYEVGGEGVGLEARGSWFVVVEHTILSGHNDVQLVVGIERSSQTATVVRV